MYFRLYFSCLLLLFLCSCDNINHSVNDLNRYDFKQENIKYAKHFGILKNKEKSVIFITENFKDTLYFEVNQTFKRLAVMGTIPVFQLYLLNTLQSIVAIDDVKYYNLSEIKKLVSSHQIIDVMPNLQWNYEALLSQKPDVLITYSNLSENHKLLDLLKNHSVKHLMYLDYLEQHPLGRAEWIKVLGCLIGKDSLAEKIFNEIENKYLSLSNKMKDVNTRPAVFTEIMYGDAWYIAGGKSYIAQLITDAGGKYVFDFHQYENAKPYSFEYVLKYAQNADFWLHFHQYSSLRSLAQANSKYTLFKAYQNQNCFNNNKRQNAYGYNDYYESGICLPYQILEDMIAILHPDVLPNHSFHYYYKLSFQ